MDQTTFSHYSILKKLGAGGMGEVYLAQDTSELGRTVALKILSAEVAKDKDRLQRFTQEARTVSNLNHPNILTVHEFGQTDSASFIATEYIDGVTLREHLSSRRLKLLDVLDVTIQIVAALNAAHEAGVTHRDLKPENVMVRSDHIVKVLDFGLAKLTELTAAKGGTNESDSSEDVATKVLHTEPGVIMGTVAYMSPEQSVGKGVDQRTDIWSVGVVLYEMIAGCVPFPGKDIHRQIIAIQEAAPAPLTQQVEDVPERLEEIVTKCLAKDKDERYQTAKDLLIDLRNLRRKLDVDAEIERSVVPGFRSSSGSSYLNTQSSRMGTASAAPAVTTSSAEYLVSQIKHHKRGVALTATLLIGVLAVVVYIAFSRAVQSGAISSLAVMPFVNASGNADVDYLSDGMTETLISSLSHLPRINVKARSSVFHYKGKETSPRTLGKELNVQAILYGRVVQRGDQLTLSLELTDASTENVIWSEQYNRKQTDLVNLQSEIARDVSIKLKTKLSGTDEQKVAKSYTANSEAYQLYLRGRFNWNKRTSDGLKKAAVTFKEAIERDPSFALAYSGLAETYVLFSAYSAGLSEESFPQAKAAALKAIELDGSLAEPHAALGAYYGGFAWNPVASERELRKAIELNPNYPTAYHWLGNLLPILGKNEEAIEAARRAEELDPLSAIISADTAYDLILIRRYDDALAQAQRTLLIDPNFYYAHYISGKAYNLKGRYADAIGPLRRAVELNPDPIAKAMLAQSLARSGQRAEAVKLVDQLRVESERLYVPKYFLATAYFSLGEIDTAIAMIEQDIRERCVYMQWITVDPELDGLRNNPRFAALVEKVKSSKLD